MIALPLRSSLLPVLTLSMLPASAHPQCPIGQRFGASDAAVRAGFGLNLALDGDVLIVTDVDGTYAFHRSAGSWAEEAVLTPAGGYRYYGFLGTVAVSGDTALVGDLDGAHVFRRQASGGWSEEATLVGDDTVPFTDNYGVRVDLEGERAVVTAWRHAHPGAPGTGAAYVFERSGTRWSQVAEVLAEEPPGPEELGASVSLDGDRLALGTTSVGKAVCLFERDGAAWVQRARLRAADPSAYGEWGRTAALSGDTLLVGCKPFGSRVAVYRFERVDGVWEDRGELVRLFAGPAVLPALALEGERALVGVQQEDDYLGAAHLFQRSQGAWAEAVRFSPIQPEPCGEPALPPLCAELGTSVALSGDTVASGALFDDFVLPDAGAVYVADLDDLLPATVASRNAGSNPDSYVAGHAYVGESWRLQVDVGETGHTHGLVVGFDSPGTLLLGGGQTLLCLDLGGNGELLNTGFLPAGPGGRVVLDVPVPAVPALVGQTLCTQAVQAFGLSPFALSNAQDVVIGGCP